MVMSKYVIGRSEAIAEETLNGFKSKWYLQVMVCDSELIYLLRKIVEHTGSIRMGKIIDGDTEKNYLQTNVNLPKWIQSGNFLVRNCTTIAARFHSILPLNI